MTGDGGRESAGGLLRSSRVMALGTLASRVTGFLRTAVIATAIGYAVGDAYNVANTIPNILYDLLLGGVLTSVLVPLLVQASTRDGDGGEAYAQRLVTVVLASLAVISALAVALAPLIVRLYAHRLTDDQLSLATTFARFFLPQILFYGAGAILGAILNTRGSFGPPMWAPVLNNVVVIATGGAFLAITTEAPSPGGLSTTQVLVLSIGTTGGIVVQTLALLPALRRVGFRWRWRWDLRGAGLRSAGAFAAWMVGYVATNQLGYLVIVNLATAAGRASGAEQIGYSSYSYAFVLFSLPYAVVAVSVITALFPQMSRSGATADGAGWPATWRPGSTCPASCWCPAPWRWSRSGRSSPTVVLAHGHISLDQARLIGVALGAFAVGLVPFSAFQLQLRAWLAMGDSRTPALVNVVVTALNVVADVALYLTLPARLRVAGLALGFSLSYLAGMLIFVRLVRTRVGIARGAHVTRTHVRLVVASVPAVLVAFALAHLTTSLLGATPAPALVALVVGAAAGIPIFVAGALRMRVDEVRRLADLARRRVGAPG